MTVINNVSPDWFLSGHFTNVHYDYMTGGRTSVNSNLKGVKTKDKLDVLRQVIVNSYSKPTGDHVYASICGCICIRYSSVGFLDLVRTKLNKE